jgi:NADPH2:quinone reductase
MRAVGVNHYGGPEALEVVDLPEPHAGPGQLRIRVHAAAVNPTDTYVRNGDRAKQQQKDPPPYVPGMDAAGVLDEIGDGVDTDLRVGDPVMAIVIPDGSYGAYSEYLALPAASVGRSPKGASHAEACTLPMNGLTARLSLDELGLSPGDTILVTGAAGCFGGYVVQLAKADGLRVIADASPADEELVRALGADVVLARGDDLSERVRELEPGGVDGVADGAVMNQLLVPAVRDGGGFASVRGWKGEPQRDITFYATFVRRYAEEQARLDRLREQAESGAVTLRVARTFPAEQAGEAHRLLEGGGIRGRLVVEL